MLVDMLYLCQSTFKKYQCYFFCQKYGKSGENRTFSDKLTNLILKSIQLWIEFLGYAGSCGMSNDE